jgi:hypothetical protein
VLVAPADARRMMQTSDYPCMRKSKDVPDMHFRNFDIPVRATCASASTSATFYTRTWVDRGMLPVDNSHSKTDW